MIIIDEIRDFNILFIKRKNKNMLPEMLMSLYIGYAF